MKTFWLQVELLLHRYGWFPIVALIPTAIGGWLFWIESPQLLARAQAYRESLVALALEAKHDEVAAPPSVPLIQARHEAFRAHLAPKQTLPTIVRTFFTEAQKAGLVLRQMDYKLTAEKDSGYLAYRIDVPIAGAYSHIYRFAEGILVDTPAMALEDISFKRDSVHSTNTEAKLRFVVYLKDTS
jgi:hypothetical protein